MTFKPMLASDANLEKLRFPLLASPKLDGIRAIIIEGKVWSRSLKLIPNKQVQERFGGKPWLEYFDGELIVGEPTSKTCYRDTVSAVMADDRPNEAKLWIFDHIEHPNLSYRYRLGKLIPDGINVMLVPQVVINNLEELVAHEEQMLEAGYEGLILRDPNAKYKYGRSTANEGILLKLKRFVDAEAVVIGFEERMHNANEAKKNELGQTERSSHQANKIGRGDLGALRVRMGEVEFNIGTGFDDAERKRVWENRDNLVGAIAKFKYFPVGVKDAPRHPVFLGWRLKEDQ